MLRILDQVDLVIIKLNLIGVDDREPAVWYYLVHAVAFYLDSKGSWTRYAIRHRHHSAWCENRLSPVPC